MRSRRMLFAILGSLAPVLAACEHNYVYQPTVATTSAVAGRPASYYAIPPEAPRGSVQLVTFGFANIHPKERSEGGDVRAIHMRMVVANNSGAPWTLDMREQLLSLPQHGSSRPAYAASDAGAGPILSVPPLGKATIDLFYPLPSKMQDAEHVPAFDTVWKVQTDARLVADRTPFERLEIIPNYDYDYSYWGPRYYYDRRDVIIQPSPGHPSLP